MNDEVLLFVREGCPLCPAARAAVVEAARRIRFSVHVHDVDSWTGRAEALFHDVQSVPTLIVERTGKRLVGTFCADDVVKLVQE